MRSGQGPPGGLEEAATLRQVVRARSDRFEGQAPAASPGGQAPAGRPRLAVEMLIDGMVGLPAPEDLAWYLGYHDPSTIDTGAVVAEVIRKAPERRVPVLALTVVPASARGGPRRFSVTPRHAT